MLTLLRPRFWPGHLAMIFCVAIATGLGLWQYDAWQTRRADSARDISDEKPVALDSVMTGDSPFPGRDLGRPVTFTGTWVGDNVYVADRDLDGKVGYWVVTAAEVDGSDSAMPVVRGWSAEPDQPAAVGDTEVTGWLQATEGSGPFDQDPTDNVIPTMRIASLVEKVDADLFSGYVVAQEITGDDTGDDPGDDTGAAAGLEPVTPEAVPSVGPFTALRNFLYAIEWWIFGGFAFFIWFRWCRDSLYPPEPEQDPTPEPADEAAG